MWIGGLILVVPIVALFIGAAAGIVYSAWSLVWWGLRRGDTSSVLADADWKGI